MDFEQLHHVGMLFIQFLQITFKQHSKFMIWLSNLSNPNWSYIVYFPVTYYLHKSVGRRVLWVAAIAEWLNAVLKWILHGERPYWWAHEAGMCNGIIKPCNQFYITCETGPGSPSGHCMVTISVFYVMVSALLFHYFKHRLYRSVAGIALWAVFGILTLAINISRCFISAHFPHQVVLGTVIGILTAVCFDHISTSVLTLKHYLWAAVGMLLVSVLTYTVLIQMGLDPHWSVTKAERWCAHAKWIHLSTTLFASIAKASASLIGLGLAELGNHPDPVESEGTNSYGPAVSTIIRAILALVFAFLAERVHISQDNEMLFYIFTYVKYIVIIFVIAAVIPRIFKSPIRKKCNTE